MNLAPTLRERLSELNTNFSAVSTKVYIYQQVYLPELLERVSAGKILEAPATYRSASISVFSLVMTCNNKKDGAIFGYHITFCAITQYL